MRPTFVPRFFNILHARILSKTKAKRRKNRTPGDVRYRKDDVTIVDLCCFLSFFTKYYLPIHFSTHGGGVFFRGKEEAGRFFIGTFGKSVGKDD